MADFTQKPFAEWTTEEMKVAGSLVGEARIIFGIQAARELMEKLGFPTPPAELIMPIEELEKLRDEDDED